MGAATNAAIFPMVIIVNTKSGRLAVSFRHVGRATGLRSDNIKERLMKMKSKHEDFKWNGISLFGKRFGRYNIAVVYLVTNVIISILVTASQRLLTGSASEYLRGILAAAFLGCTLFAFQSVGRTNVLLIASPKVCRFYLKCISQKLTLIEESASLSIFRATNEGKNLIFSYDLSKNMIWYE